MPVQQEGGDNNNNNNNNGTVFFDDSDVIVITGSDLSDLSDLEIHNTAQASEKVQAGDEIKNESPTEQTQTGNESQEKTQTKANTPQTQNQTPAFFQFTDKASHLREIEIKQVTEIERSRPRQEADEFVAKMPEPACAVSPEPEAGQSHKKRPKSAYSTWKSFQDPDLRC